MGQSKTLSLIEACANIVIGYTIAVASQCVIFPMFGLYVDLQTNMKMGLIFTIVSLVRSYTLRRVFNKFFDHGKGTEKGKLKVYRDFVLMLSGYIKSGHVEMSSCRVMVNIQLDRLVRDAKLTKGGVEGPEIGTTCRLTEDEHERLKKELEEYDGEFNE